MVQLLNLQYTTWRTVGQSRDAEKEVRLSITSIRSKIVVDEKFQFVSAQRTKQAQQSE